MEREEFIERFKAWLRRCAGEDYDEGYANEIAPTYWDDPEQRSEGPEDCAEAEYSEWGPENSILSDLIAARSQPAPDEMRAFGASHVACYKWPKDTVEHRALRAAYIDGAANSQPAPPSPSRRRNRQMSENEIRELRSIAIDSAIVMKWLIDTLAPPLPPHIQNYVRAIMTSAEKLSLPESTP